MSATTPVAWCPDRSHSKRQLTHEKGQGYRCPACGARFPARLVHARPALFTEPEGFTPQGYDPLTGFEVQDLP